MSGSNPEIYAGIPVESRRLLATLDTYACQELEVLLFHLLDEGEIALVDSAFLTNSTQTRLLALEAVGVLRRVKTQPPVLCPNSCFLQQPAIDTAEHQAGHQLALMALEELDVQLALKSAIRHGGERCSQSQFSLLRRLGYLLGRELLETEFPLAVVLLLRSVCRELLAAGVAVTLLPLLLGTAKRTLVDGLIQLYDELNERLKRAGVLPELEVNRWPELQRFRNERSAPVSPQPVATPVAGVAPEPSMPLSAAAVPAPAVYHASRQLLQLLHETAPQHGQSDAELLSADRMLEALSTLQSQQGQAVFSRPLLERVEEYLVSQGRGRLTAQSAAQIQLSERVIEMLAQLLQELPELQQLVQRLEIPLAAASIADADLFERPEHPAQLLVNTMGELSAYRGQIDGALGARIADILTPVTDTVPSSPTQMAAASKALATLNERQRKAREKNIQRLVESCEGQQRLLQASNAVDRELHNRLAHIELARPIVNLVENGWRELLRLTYLREGPDSEAWVEAIGLLDELLWRFSRLGKGGDSQGSVAEVAALTERVRRCLERSFPSGFRHAELVESVRAVLSLERPLQLEQGAFAFPLRPARVKGLLRTELDNAFPELAPWLRRLRDYRVGDTFSHRGDLDGTHHTLVWISADHQNFVFVDNAGAKSLDLDIVDFARELSRGFSPVVDSDRQSLVNRAISSSAQTAFEKIIDRQSVDEITGLLNHRFFEEKVQTAVLRARSQQQRYTLLYIDVDRFSVVNQLYGHAVGDELLRLVGITLAQVADSDAEVARLVGNEFAVLLPTECNRALVLAEAMQDRVKKTVYHLAAGNAEVTLSIGVVEIDKFSESSAGVMRDALFACSEAKGHGRDQLQLFEGGSEVISRRDRMLHWINKMGELLDEEALALRAQPIVAVTDTAQISHYEVLLGLRNESGVLQSPIEFIEAAERYGSMRRVDRWVIDKALAWLGAQARGGRHTPSLAINLSANSLNDPSLADFLFERFGAHGVSPKLVCFEITETATIDNLISTADFIRRVKRLGCSFALDDFGTGRCSYEYLKQLPVDYLKIDGAFIESINDSTEDLLIVRSINEIAHAMGIRTIAEYVSSDAVLARLIEVGVDFAQGFAIGRPVAIAEIETAPVLVH